MSIISRINADLLKNLGSSSSSSSASPAATASSTLLGKGKGASFDQVTVNISGALTKAATAFAHSYTRMSGAVSIFDVAKDSLAKLLKLTDDMLELADKATDQILADVDRKRLNSLYKVKVKEFRKVLDSASQVGVDLLNKDDLETALKQAGIEPSQATALAQAFAQIAGKDGELGYEKFSSEDQPFTYLKPTSGGTGTFQPRSTASPTGGGVDYSRDCKRRL